MGPRLKSNFSEYGHVTYQIKADNFCSNIGANILPTDTPSVGSKGQTIYFCKYAVITHTNDPWGGVKRSFFS